VNDRGLDILRHYLLNGFLMMSFVLVTEDITMMISSLMYMLFLSKESIWQFKYPTYHGNVPGGIETRTPFMYYDGYIWSAENLSNYAFGYFGAAFGYSEEFLCFGAGVYQVLSPSESEWGFFESYWDDPIDQANIRMGYQKYKNTR